MAEGKDTENRDGQQKGGAEKGASGAAASKKRSEQAKSEAKPKSGKAETAKGAATPKSESKPASEKKPAAKKPAAKKTAAKKPEAEKAAPARKRAPAKRAAKSKQPAAKSTGNAEPTVPVVRARARFVRVAPRKARLVADSIRGLGIDEARSLLRFSTRGAARDLAKLIDSAAANAEENHELVADELRVSEVRVDEGPTLRRYRPRAQGRATRINKRTSHISVWLVPDEED